MYRNEKKTLIDICDTLKEIHIALVKGAGQEEAAELCDAAQQGAIRIGESLENEDAERYAGTVHKLEEYCEHVYELSEEETVSNEDIEELDHIVHQTEEKLKGIRCRLKIVFFPYKAEMWDSLESFYLAARDDPECDAYLVPIPYYEMDENGGEARVRYEIDRFPMEEKPIMYSDFDHTDGSIDIAYVHNPYDDHNLVTSVHPSYYSRELKKHVGKLVYAPYFVTAGMVVDEQLMLPVYENMDYFVIQSELAKKCCEGMPYYDKILAFGSSKFDMIINKNRKGGVMPEGWAEVLGDRRKLLLNSSINDLLQTDEAALDKLEYFFDLIRGNKKVAVIWRPHPLYESTLRAMRPQLLQRYEKIKARFLEDRIGVYDETPDISNTIALCDGYIGSGHSSVINMVCVTGKPAYMFNNILREKISRDDRRVLRLSGMSYYRGRLYMYPINMNAIFSVDAKNVQSPLKYEGSIPNIKNWTRSLVGLVELDGKMYLSPLFADDAVCYDPIMKSVEKLEMVGRKMDIRYVGIAQSSSGKSLYYIPDRKYLMIEYVVKTGEWIYHSQCISDLYEGLNRPPYIGLLYGASSYDDVLYFSTGLCNRILGLKAGTDEYRILHIGQESFTEKLRIVIKSASSRGLWLSMGGETDLYLAPWDNLSDINKWTIIHMPEDLLFFHDDVGDPFGFHGGIVEYGSYAFIMPLKTPHMLRIDLRTGEVGYIAEDFFKDSDKKGIEYDIKYSSIGGVVCSIGNNKVVIQRMRDLHIAIINLDDGSYEEFVPEIPEEIFDRIVPEDGGFYKGDRYDYFRMDESRLFPLEHFLDVFARDGYRNVKERQLNELETLAANLDGTCGVKTHEFLKRVIEEEDRREFNG